MNKIIFLVPFLLISCTTTIDPLVINDLTTSQSTNSVQIKLIKELTSVVDQTLLQSQKVSNPTNAEKLANKVFPEILKKTFNKPLKSLNYQFQAQAQWTVNKTIQLQLQAQMSDEAFTAQIQRQINFKPL